MFPARPTSGKTPLIGTWLRVGATDSIGGGREERGSCDSLGGGEIVVVAMAKKTEVVADRERERERGKEATHPT